MVVKGLQHLGYNSFGNKTIHLPLFPFEILQVFTSARQKTEKLHTGIDVFFRSFGGTVLKKTDQEIGFLVIPFQTDRFSFCASKFEDAIC